MLFYWFKHQERKGQKETKRKNFCSHDMKMFILLIGDKVKVTVESKLFLYLASEKEMKIWNVKIVKNCIISLESRESDVSF